MSPPWWKTNFSRDSLVSPPAAAPPAGSRSWPFWGILGLALLARLIWLDLSWNFIGADAVRYLWIGQHVSRGDWGLLPQLFSSPLLPALIGLLAPWTGDHLLAGRIISILSNTLAVGLAMLLMRRLFPRRPALAWLTGLGLAVNHVWCRLAPFVLTDNLFYPLLLGLLLLLALLLEKVTWTRALAFGLVWGLLFFSREIGLYCGGLVFLVLMANLWRQCRRSQLNGWDLGRVNAGLLPVLGLMLCFWGAWYYHSFGIVSIGEGRRFYTSYTQKFDRQGRYPFYENATGTLSFFHLRPYEVMEFTRFPSPHDERFPPSGSFTLLHEPLVTLGIIWDNFLWTCREFQRVSLIGFVTLFFLIPLGVLTRRLSMPELPAWTFAASLGVLGLHFLGPVREARLIGWFFPWIYLALAWAVLWLWQQAKSSALQSLTKNSLLGLIGGVFFFTIFYPQYFKEIPKRWRLRQAPQVHLLAGEAILKNFGAGAVIASREPEAVYRGKGYWIGLPYGAPEAIVAWLYLGGADLIFLNDVAPVPEEEKIFWADPKELAANFPELEIVADFSLPEFSAYGRHGRLLRFRPEDGKLAALRKQFPWAGTHPRVTGAWAPARPGTEKQPSE